MLQRRFDCNCHACSCATYPHEHENVDPMIDRNVAYVIRGCLRDADSSDDYENRCVRRLDNQAEQALRKASEKVGNELAKEWNAKRIGAGQCLLVQNSDPTADGHQLWCCRTVNSLHGVQAEISRHGNGLRRFVCSTSFERKQECRTLSGWLLASAQSPCNGTSRIRQLRTTGSSRSCMTR